MFVSLVKSIFERFYGTILALSTHNALSSLCLLKLEEIVGASAKYVHRTPFKMDLPN